MVILKIGRTPGEEEWQVVWIEGRERDEGRTSYHSDIEDAVDTAIFNLKRYPNTVLSRDGYTRRMFEKFRPDYLEELTEAHIDRWGRNPEFEGTGRGELLG